MKKKWFKALVSLMMATLMALCSPLMSIAQEQDGMYLADLKIGYGDEGKAALESSGYKVCDQNANETGQGQAVYIGYKTTNVAEEAITDIATMNMNGRYSFDKYAQYLQEVTDAAAVSAKKFNTAVNEFAEQFEGGQATEGTSDLAKAALKILNKFYDDDYKDSEGNVSNKLGDMIINGKMTDDELTKIFYQGNSDNVKTIKQLIAFGITETGDDTFLIRLSNYEYTDQLDNSLAGARTSILNQMPDVKDYMLSAKEYGEAAYAYEGGKDAYIASFSSQDDKDKVTAYIGAYDAAVDIQYGSNLTMPDGTNMSLLDALTLPSQEEYDAMEETPECEYVMDTYMADILAKAMTAGQLGSLDTVPISTLVTNTYFSDDANTALTNLDEAIKDCVDISVYAGVDRSLFLHPEDVAMTASTIEEMNKGGVNTIGSDINFWDTNRAMKISIATIGCVAAAVGTVLILAAMNRFAPAAEALVYDVAGSAFNLAPVQELYGSVVTVQYLAATKAMYVIGSVAFAIAIICLIVMLVLEFTEPENPTKIEYTRIPRVLVHMVEDGADKNYYNYYAVKRIDASEDTDDFMNVYGDLNGNSELCQWQCLYCTTDSRCGKPLTSDIVFKLGNPDTTLNETNGYLAIHDFDSTAAANFNAKTGAENPTAIYAYVKQAATSDSGQNGTILESNPLAMCIAALILGAGISCGATLLVTRKRRVAK